MKFGGMITNYESGEVMMYFKAIKQDKTKNKKTHSGQLVPS
jgi:hypothetical protein